jgi:hypothetical protein
LLSLLLLLIVASGRLVAQIDSLPMEDSLLLESETDTAAEMVGSAFTPANTLSDSARAARARALYDSSAVTARLPSRESLERLRSDGELRYDVEGHAPESIWDRIGAWLKDLLGDAVMTPGVMKVIEWIFYIIAGLVLSFAIWKIVTSGRSGLLAKDGDTAGIAGGVVENIHQVDFDPLIAEAIRNGDYRGAVRLLYLKGLRTLSERGLIDWRRDALNHEYLRQLERTDLADPFARCTLLFEYVWYGDFPLDEATFGSIAGTLRGFIGRVEGRR